MLQPLTTSEMKKFEKYVCDNFDITIDEMMQNAGRAVFDVVMNEILPLPESDDGYHRFRETRILIISGKGNNGGDALVTAKLLEEEGVDVTIFQIENPKSQIPNSKFDLIIDGIFGFSLKDDPRSPYDEIINKINHSGIPILSVDVPSGLDCETGQIMNPTVKATYTVTLGMPKIGLDRYKDNVGKLYLGDLGIPQKAYQKLDIYTPIFLGNNYVALD